MKNIMGKALYSSLLVFSILFTACGEDSSDSDSGSSSSTSSKADYLADARVMTLSTQTDGMINETSDHTTDAYKIAITKEGKYSINLKLLDGSVNEYYSNIWAIVYDEDGNELITLDESYIDAPNDFYASTEFDVLSSGNIYVKIGRDGNLASKYSLHIYPSVANGLSQDPTTFEPNGVKSSAKAITLTESTNGIESSVNVTDKMDITDFYKLPLSETGKYLITLKLLDGSVNEYYSNIWAVIYDEDGTKLITLDYSFVDAPNEEYTDIEFDVFSSGNIYIEIGRDSNLATKYSLTIKK